MTRRTSVSIVGLACLAALAAADATALFYLAPLLVLLVPLLARRYPGERLLLRAVRSRGRPRPARVLAPPARKPRAALPSGGRLIAAGLAVRPPPLLSIEV
jgi:hypothetical protein